MAGSRFTAWLSEDERDELRALAGRQQCSENFIVRMALRALLFDKPVPTYLQPRGVTDDSRTHSTTR